MLDKAIAKQLSHIDYRNAKTMLFFGNIYSISIWDLI